MARVIENTKNFLILELSTKEAESIGFGTPEGCICMHCNSIIKDSLFYIAALNDVMDKECFEQWIDQATHYPEDSLIENHNYEYVLSLLEQAKQGHTRIPQYPTITIL